ncbi:MAG: tRNA pseudouridine(55) synthase TruB [Beutenbergiaceae bacterium]
MSVGDGLLLVDKPAGITSHGVVARARRATGTKKIGHAGTLDPMATGLLVLGVNRATRLLTYLVGADKVYRATIRLGQATVTDDAEGDITAEPGALGIDEARVRSAVAAFTGPIMQVPSAVSAIRVDGQRAYARVRAGEAVELAARPVTIHRFDVLATRATQAAGDIAVLDVDVEVECSSGTYIRALARDLGTNVHSGGHLVALRRTRVGGFTVDEASGLADLDQARLLDTTAVARRVFPGRDLTQVQTNEIRYGRRISASDSQAVVAAYAPDGHLVALLADRDNRAQPVLVLDPV